MSPDRDDYADGGISAVRSSFLDQPAATYCAPPDSIARAAHYIAAEAHKPWPFAPSGNLASRVFASILDNERVTKQQFPQLAQLLKQEGVLTDFFRAAAVNDDTLRRWLQGAGVTWDTIYKYYEFGVKDAIDFSAGYLAGIGISFVDISGLITVIKKSAELQQLAMAATITSLLDKGITSTAGLYFDTVVELLRQLRQIDFVALARTEYDTWRYSLSEKLYRLQYFQAGAQFGEAIGTILQLVEAGIGLARVAPVLARGAAQIARAGLNMAVRTAEDLVRFAQALKAMGAAQFMSLSDLTRAPRLFLLVPIDEIKLFLRSGQATLRSSYGFEFIRVKKLELGHAAELVPVPASGPARTMPGGSGRQLMAHDVIVVRDGQGNIVGRFEPDIRPKDLDELFEQWKEPWEKTGQHPPTTPEEVAAARKKFKGEWITPFQDQQLRGLLDSLRDRAANSVTVKTFLGVPKTEVLTVARVEELGRKLPYKQRFRLSAVFGTEMHKVVQGPVQSELAPFAGELIPQFEKQLRQLVPQNATSRPILGMKVRDFFATVDTPFGSTSDPMVQSFLKLFGDEEIGRMKVDLALFDQWGSPKGIYDWTPMPERTIAAAQRSVESGGTGASIPYSKQIHQMKTMFYNYIVAIYTDSSKTTMIRGGDAYYGALNIW